MYTPDALDAVARVDNIPSPQAAAPCPLVFAQDGKLVLSYWPKVEPTCDESPLALVRFREPHFHAFVTLNEEAIAGHPLAERGLYPYGVFEVKNSSLVRRLQGMNSFQGNHDPKLYRRLTHYIFTFHDSIFECIAASFEATVAQIGWDEEHESTLRFFNSS